MEIAKTTAVRKKVHGGMVTSHEQLLHLYGSRLNQERFSSYQFYNILKNYINS